MLGLNRILRGLSERQHLAGIFYNIEQASRLFSSLLNAQARRLFHIVLFFLLLQLGIFSPALSARENFREVDIVPVAGKVIVDGDLKDWDQSGFIDTFYELSMYPNYSMRIGFMHDAEALYIAAHFADSTPMVNAIDPTVNPKEGWKGDALQVRLISNPAAPYPFKEEKSKNDQICHMTLWYYTAKGQPVINFEYGMDFHGLKTYLGEESGAAFKKDSDGKGYTVEARIPWERLHVSMPGALGRLSGAQPAVKAGDTITLTVQPLWGNDKGTANAISYFDITAGSGSGFHYGNAQAWGRAIFSSKGNVAPRPNRLLASGDDAASKPLTIKLALDDPKSRTISLGLFDKDKGLIRSLPVSMRRESQLGADFELAWDGLDADGKPIQPGTYQLKQLTHQGIGQKFIASLHNSGNPPWKTDDGLGQWGGDWSPPVGAAADNDFTYLAWGACEAGPALVCVKKELDKNGLYQKVWGSHPAMHNDVGFGITALATDGERLFVAQDGKTYGGHKDKNADAFAAVTVYDAKTGRPQSFPFGKPRLSVAQWEISRITAEREKPLFERRKTGDFGPQQLGVNLTGIAVQGDMLYAALFLDGKVVSFNWKTGTPGKEFPASAPSGVAIDPSGKLIVASAKGLLRIDPNSGATETLASDKLSRPWGVSVDKQGNIAVSDCGKSMQVKVFSPDGKLLREVGKTGGRAWIGSYDPAGILMPSGLAVDGDGKIWVAENDEFPRRVSVWDVAGKNVGDFHGPCVPQTDRGVDPANPSRINCQMVEYDLDYNTGKYKCVTTLWRPHVDGWTPVSNFGVASRFLIRNVKGRQYAFLDHGYADRLGVILIRKGDRLQACASLGFGSAVPIVPQGGETFGTVQNPEQWLGPEKWKAVWDAGRKAYNSPNQLWHVWVDKNDDGIVQPDELEIERREWSDPFAYWFNGVDDDLTLTGLGGYDQVYRIPVKGFTEQGVPLYPGRKEVKPLFTKLSKADASIWIDAKHQRVFGFEAKGGDTRMRGEWAGVSCYDFSGKLLWLYRDTWLGFASDSPFFKAGLVIGVNKFIGQADLDNGVSLLVMPGYYGDYSMLSTDGLWVHSFCQDNRLGGGAGPDTVFIENMTGIFYRNAKNGKVYLVGGDIDARVWEVTGLETIRTKETSLTISQADCNAATAAAKNTKSAKTADAIQMAKIGKIEIDGKTADWKFDRAVSIDAGAGRGAKVLLGYDDKYLYVAFKVDDRSPMTNAATDPAMLFKGGDVCDIMLATDAKADPKREKPAIGDSRLSFSVLDNKPVCVLYQAISNGPKAPKTFSSPTGNEVFERVQILENAKVAIQRTDTGYELEAAVPLSDIGFVPAAGMKTRGDVGVLFSTDGGGRTILRAYYANKDTSIVEDVPSEARLAPAKWTTMEVGQ